MCHLYHSVSHMFIYNSLMKSVSIVRITIEDKTHYLIVLIGYGFCFEVIIIIIIMRERVTDD